MYFSSNFSKENYLPACNKRYSIRNVSTFQRTLHDLYSINMLAEVV